VEKGLNKLAGPLREGVREIPIQIYAPKFYYERVLTFLCEVQPPKIRVHLELQYILALGRSIYQLGFHFRQVIELPVS